MNEHSHWVPALNAKEIPLEDVTRWDHAGNSYAIIRTAEDAFFATADICTHEHAHMSDGYVDGDTIECPRHAASFCVRTGDPLTPPACVALRTFPAKVEDGIVLVQLD